MKRRSELCKIDIDEYVWVLKSTFYVNDGISFLNLRFENDVEMYGTQTVAHCLTCCTCLRMM